MKLCISCGMPLTMAEDYPLKDETKDYCIHCAREDGTMQSFEEKKDSMADFIMNTQGIDKSVAYKAAEELMRQQPAWKEYFA